MSSVTLDNAVVCPSLLWTQHCQSFQLPSGTGDLHCLLTPCPTPLQESGRGVSRITQMKCHHSWNEVPANEGLSPPFSKSLCTSTVLQLVADITGGVIPDWAWSWLSGPCWPPVTLGFDDRLGFLCSSTLSR